MRRQISKRLEALERAAEKEVFVDAFFFAVAYYLGGAKDLSECEHAHARALGYHDLAGLLADLFKPSDSLDKPSGIRARALEAQRKLLAKFGYNVYRASPATLTDAAYRIVRSLPEEWRAMIKSAHRESCESEAEVNELLKGAMKIAEESSKHARPHQTAPRRP
jgi:hypothetical protein